MRWFLFGGRAAGGGAAGAALLVGGLLGAVVPAAASGSHTLWVATSGNDANPCSQAQPCKTISHAVTVAAAGDTVKVQSGTYAEGVTITKQLKVLGLNNPTVDATTSSTGNGFLLQGPGASWSKVDGFTVENAKFEGILAQAAFPTANAPGTPISNVTITHNLVQNNDTGYAAQADGECHPPAPQIPGDCGEGIHLFTAIHSVVADNTVRDNAGGILLTDEFGPNHDNYIARNHVYDNPFDCGITVVGHNHNAVSTSGPNAGQRQPSLGGVYSNNITDNLVQANGTQGEGGGILLAAAGPGMGSYGNWIIGNTAEGNGLGGVVLHSHFGFQDLNDNVIKNNHLRLDNLSGAHTDFAISNNVTTAIQIGSGLPPGATGAPPPGPITGTTVFGNVISDVHDGIWTLNSPLDSDVVDDNTFAADVTTPLEAH